jgi:hypothetical protein
MFEGDKETFAQAIRNECMCGPDGDLSDWDRNWNEMWQSISQQETCPDKESVEALLDVMLDTRIYMADMDEERSEYLSGLIDRWRSDKEAKQEAVDTISAEVFDDVARRMGLDNVKDGQYPVEEILDCPSDHEVARIEIALSHGMDIHAKDEEGTNMLHYCSTTKAAELLMEKGLTPVRDSDGKYPGDYAKEAGREKLAEILKAKEPEQVLRDRAGIGRGRQREHEMSL